MTTGKTIAAASILSQPHFVGRYIYIYIYIYICMYICIKSGDLEGEGNVQEKDGGFRRFCC